VNRRLRTPHAVCLAFALVLSSSLARADEYDAALTRAVAAKERALDTNDPADWQQALDLFAKAVRVRATKEAEYELGGAAARLRQDDLAVEAYESSLALGLQGSAADKARAFIAEKGPDMGRLVVTGPAGAEVWLADRPRGTLPLSRPIVVFAGQRSIRVLLGERVVTRDVVVGRGASVSLDVGGLLEAPPASPAATAPPPLLPPPRADVPPAERTGPSPAAWPLTIAGGSLALLSGATVLLAGSNLSSHRDRLATSCAVLDGTDACREAKPGQRTEAQDEVDSIATWNSVRTGGFVGLGVGLVATGIGVVLLIDGKKRARSSVMLAPARQGAGVSIVGPIPL